jgi:hypothetical protein
MKSNIKSKPLLRIIFFAASFLLTACATDCIKPKVEGQILTVKMLEGGPAVNADEFSYTTIKSADGQLLFERQPIEDALFDAGETIDQYCPRKDYEEVSLSNP